jgi:multiple sugar transport system ATP-binding protein
MATVQLDSVNKVYENGFHAIHDLNLDVRDKEFLVLVGPSGCGKSTALRMVAGLETITGGELKIGDRIVNDVEPKDRDIAMVFQNYALYPHMSVYDNIGFALKLAKVPKDEIDTRVRKAAEMLELTANLDRKPGQLSGGQRQRVAMGRAIVRQPAAFLMDEPLSNLDAKLRVQMRAQIAALQRDGVCDARSDRSDDDGRSRCGVEGRLFAAGRYASESVRPAGQCVRGGVHRFTVDEPV